jgi:Domain of unknown function (DUF4249)
MKQAWRIAAAAAWVIALACTNLEAPTPATESQLVVQAVLDAAAASQSILIYRARTGQNAITGGVSEDEPVLGAVASVTGPNGVVMEAQETANPGTYTIPADRPVPDSTYTLFVRTPTGEQVSGRTTVPGVGSTIVVPLTAADTFFRLKDTLRISWPRVPGARSYEIVTRSTRSNVEYRTFTDTNAVTLPGTALTIGGHMVFPPRERVDVLVVAVDANYYDYYRAQSDPFAGAAPTRLIGAVGVFGSLGEVFATALRVR